MASLLSTNVNSILNVMANIANTGNLFVTQNTFTGNLSVTQNATFANATVNSVNFIPVWTNMTVNNSGTGNGVNAWVGVQTGLDTAGFWTDPFGIVHLRGLLANGAQNVTFSNTIFLNTNIANGLPIPTTNVVFGVPVQANGNGAGNVCSAVITLYHNNAMQIINIAGPNGDPLMGVTTTSWNLGNLSLYSLTYNTH